MTRFEDKNFFFLTCDPLEKNPYLNFVQQDSYVSRHPSARQKAFFFSSETFASFLSSSCERHNLIYDPFFWDEWTKNCLLLFSFFGCVATKFKEQKWDSSTTPGCNSGDKGTAISSLQFATKFLSSRQFQILQHPKKLFCAKKAIRAIKKYEWSGAKSWQWTKEPLRGKKKDHGPFLSWYKTRARGFLYAPFSS